MSFEVYNDFEHPAVRETYAILEREGEHLLNTSYIWTKTWWDVFRDHTVFGYDKQIYLIRVLRESVPCAMLALMRYKKVVRKSMGLVSYTTLGICGDCPTLNFVRAADIFAYTRCFTTNAGHTHSDSFICVSDNFLSRLR